MATTSTKEICYLCGKKKVVYECKGCSHNFCLNDLNEHRMHIEKQFDEFQNDYNRFQEKISRQKQDLTRSSLLQQINDWENNAIMKIQATAEECRKILLKHINENIIEIQTKLFILADEIKKIDHENEFNEIDLHELKHQLEQIAEDLDHPKHIKIQEESISFINKISICAPLTNVRWVQNGVTIAGGHGEGTGMNQLDHPWSLVIDEDQTVYVVDQWNARIMQWKPNATNGQLVAGGTGEGNRTEQLYNPTDLIIDKETDNLIICDYENRRVMRWPRLNGTTNQEIILQNIHCRGLAMDDKRCLYITDDEKHEVRKYQIGETNGTVVAGGNGQGDGLNQLNEPQHVFIDRDYSIYVSDNKNHRVMKWMKGATEGIVVAGGQGNGDELNQLSFPNGVFVDSLGAVYVADSGNDRVTRWHQNATQGEIIIGNSGRGERSNQLNTPTGLSLDQYGHLYVVDHHNHRVQRFSIERS